MTIAQKFVDECKGKSSWGACLNVLDEKGFRDMTLSATDKIIYFEDNSLAVFHNGFCRSYRQD